MVGIPGPELDHETRAFLIDHSVGGVVLFRRNVSDPEGLVALTDALHGLFPERPLLVGIDHEGGRITRLESPFTAFPAAARVGAAGSPHLAYRMGIAIGEELREIGVDVDFAPVLDVLTNPRNPVIGDRAYGSNPRTVARMGIAFAHGLQRSGVLPCAKHFPGHGDTHVDSHLDLPAVRKSFSDLERNEIFPFRRALQSGVDCLMTAHVVFSAIDAVRPATLSRRILTELLRTRLRFRGVVFTDDLEMKAIADRWTPEEAAIAAVEAGADCLLVCEHLEVAGRAIAGLERAAEQRPALRSRIEESTLRLDRLLRSHLQRPRPPRRGPLSTLSLERHQNVVRWVEERAARGRIAS